jgi:ATP-dependent protease Clp ATPase subunit
LLANAGMNNSSASIHDAIGTGHIKHFADLLNYLSRSELMAFLDVQEDQLLLLIEDPESISVKQLDKLARLFNVDIYYLMEALTGRSKH